VVVVAPATAAFLARYAAGIADDLLLNVLLATKAQVFLAPAMHTEMWQHAATVSNVATLRARGVQVLDPAFGQLTGNDIGQGRLPEPQEIVDWVLTTLGDNAKAVQDSKSKSMDAKHIVVTAGGTREPIDAVRFIGNYSSGKQGIAIARQAALRSAKVTLIGANIGDPRIAGCSFIAVTTGQELSDALGNSARSADAVIMAAAVADFRVAEPASSKIKKSASGDSLDLHLVPTPDIIAGLSRQLGLEREVLLVAFAAETLGGEALVAEARRKLESKGVNYIVANDVSEGKVFGSDATSVFLVDRQHAEAFTGDKDAVAGRILDSIADQL